MRTYISGTALVVAVALGACSFSGGAKGTPDGGSGTIDAAIDAPVEPVLAFDAAATGVTEGQDATVMVTLSRAGTAAITVPVSVSGGTAVAADYDLKTTMLTFAPGELGKPVTLTAIYDGLAEPAETVTLALGTPTGGAIVDGTNGTHDVTIAASDAPVLGFATATSSGAEAATTVSFGVGWSVATPAAMSVDYTVTGTATAGADYVLANGTIAIPAGTTGTSTNLMAQILDDTLDEDDETIVVTLSNCVNCAIDPAHAVHTHTITDNDATPTVSIAAAQASIPEAGGTAHFTVTLSAVSGRSVSVPFSTAGTATATEGADFMYATASPLVIPAGSATGTIDVTIVNDTIDDEGEIVATTLGTPTNATVGTTATASFVIIDDDPVCYGTGTLGVCLNTSPTGTVSLNGTINTGTDGRCAASQPVGWSANGNPDACVIAADTINVGNVTATGSRPLVLVAGTTINVTGNLDAGSHRGGTVGPGSPASACAVAPTLMPHANGGGGGAGGSFMTVGGDGGKGGNNTNAGGVAAAALSASPTTLRAGCNGQTGAFGGGGENAGQRGRGGGAIVLAAGGSITISGTVSAQGAGGTNGDQHTGGSGAGAGGMIVLEAPALTLSGSIWAVGGGGAAGGDNNSPGGDGNDGTLTGATAATGPGGAGGTVVVTTGITFSNNGGIGGGNQGGGGGAGGGGYIYSTVALPGGHAAAGKIDD